MYVEDADITRKAQSYGKVYFTPCTHVYHAWHRSPNKSLKPFVRQISSMLRYWRKWGSACAEGGLHPGALADAFSNCVSVWAVLSPFDI